MPKVTSLASHPLIHHKLTLLRDKETPSWLFRQLMNEAAMLMAPELFKDLPTVPKTISTPLESMEGVKLKDAEPCLVSILRAGNAFLESLRAVLPTASVGKIGLERDHVTHKPRDYYAKLPDRLSERAVFLVDPMLATGGSAVAAASYLKEKGANNIKFMCLVAAPEGIKAFHAKHPEIEILTAAIDRQLNENAYILPGLGDAGDRYYGT